MLVSQGQRTRSDPVFVVLTAPQDRDLGMLKAVHHVDGVTQDQNHPQHQLMIMNEIYCHGNISKVMFWQYICIYLGVSRCFWIGAGIYSELGKAKGLCE